MDFRANITPIEVIREDTFGGTYFRDIYSGINEKSLKIHGKNLIKQKILMPNFVHQIIMIKV